MKQLIAYAIEKSLSRDTGRDSATKYRQCAKSLSAYMGGGSDADITVQAREGWAEGYYRFLLDSYTANKDATAADLGEIRRRRALDHLRTLRRLNYNAAAEGIIPDIDFLSAIPGTGLTRTRSVTVPDFAAQVERLIGIRGTATAFAGAIDRYLLSLYLCGLPLELLPGVLDSVTETSATVRLPHLQVDLPLGDALRKKALAVKSRMTEASKAKEAETSDAPETKETFPSGHPSDIPEAKAGLPSEDGQTRENTSAEVSDNARAAGYDTLFSHLGVTLHRSGSPFTDWLSLARQTAGADDDTLVRIIRRADMVKRGEMPADDAGWITSMALAVAGRFLPQETRAATRHYYAVKVYGTTAENELASLPADAPELWPALRGNIWCPCTTTRPTTNIERIVARRGKVVDERRTVMRDLFFAYATTADIARLDRVPNLWVFQTREGTARRYTRISPSELQAMRSILDRLGPGDAIEFSITDPTGPATFTASDTVRLLLPGFEDIEAHITKRITKATPTTTSATYKIWFLTSDGKRIEMTVPPTALKSLTAV